MAEGDGLGRLQMGEARHYRGGVFERQGGERKLKRGETGVEAGDLVPHIELEVGGNLIVARPGGMQLAGHRANQLPQPALDIEMDVLQRSRKFELACLHLGQNLVETFGNLARVLLRDDTGRREHGNMSLGG
jgi:hypothetical protein